MSDAGVDAARVAFEFHHQAPDAIGWPGAFLGVGIAFALALVFRELAKAIQ